ncbi:unnamed protein product [Candida verbasci]|uniref:Mitochondrial distribution and morphology protein 10 n=1 Tax=Candida verbasci TaxID=1227364 RepID=A0A9W4TVM0_9ASCO|nr:unnamed protein product [Candida verbasci]
MYTYMEYLQKCYYKSIGWNEDNIYSNITATSNALLEFSIPNGIKIDNSNKTTDYSASSFTLSNQHQINGSLAYLYSSIPLTNTMGTKEISLQDAIAGFKIIEPVLLVNKQLNSNLNSKSSSLLYGRMYFPGSALEAMLIKRISENTQLLIKCISNPHLEKNGTMIVYLQNNKTKYSRELIFSTNELLLGVRCLYNLGSSLNSKINPNLIPKFDNSVVSIGTELWYAARTMSPGLSTALRYSTRSTSTGKPLTMTLAINPILGHVSSTYTVKTSVASTFCSKYDFNFFSYASNLSLGFELYSYSRKKNNLKSFPIKNDLPPTNTEILNQIRSIDNGYQIKPDLVSSKTLNNQAVTTAFQNLVNESDFSSVLKVSTSLNDKMMKLLWEGRCKDILVSTGVKIALNPTTNTPEVNRLGISFSYAC